MEVLLISVKDPILSSLKNKYEHILQDSNQFKSSIQKNNKQSLESI